MKKKILQLLGMVLFVGLLAGCGSNNEKTVVFSDAGWDSVKFHNAVAGLIAEKAYGLKVETMNGSTPIMEAGAGGGGFFVYMAVLHKGTVQSVESLQIDNGVPHIL